MERKDYDRIMAWATHSYPPGKRPDPECIDCYWPLLHKLSEWSFLAALEGLIGGTPFFPTVEEINDAARECYKSQARVDPELARFTLGREQPPPPKQLADHGEPALPLEKRMEYLREIQDKLKRGGMSIDLDVRGNETGGANVEQVRRSSEHALRSLSHKEERGFTRAGG